MFSGGRASAASSYRVDMLPLIQDELPLQALKVEGAGGYRIKIFRDFW